MACVGQVVKSALTFYDSSTTVHGRQTLPLCKTVNPEEKRRIIGDTFVKVADRTAVELSLTWDNLLLGQGRSRRIPFPFSCFFLSLPSFTVFRLSFYTAFTFFLLVLT